LRRDETQVAQPHIFESSRSSADITGRLRLEEHEGETIERIHAFHLRIFAPAVNRSATSARLSAKGAVRYFCHGRAFHEDRFIR
jgi:hypothetical protein